MEPIVKFETDSLEPSAPLPPDLTSLSASTAPESSLGTARLDGVSARDLFDHLFGILFTVTEVANCLKVNRVRVNGWIRDGHLPAINVQGKRSFRPEWRIRAFDLIRMAKENFANLPTHLQARQEDPFAGLVAVWDEQLGAMNLVSEAEAKAIREQQSEELKSDIDAVLKAGY